MVSMILRDDGSEEIHYDYEDYAAYIRKGFLSQYPNYRAESHWHGDLEFIYVLSGSMQYSVNGKAILLTEGTGILVNAEQLHFGFSNEKTECEFLCVLLHPMLLCATHAVEQNFVSPILFNATLPYLFLDERVRWQKEILEEIARVYEARTRAEAPLLIQAAFFHIWGLLYTNANVTAAQVSPKNAGLSAVKNMLAFIQKNYAEKISLADIANAGLVSKSSCLLLFKRYMQETPNGFLVTYRLKRAAELLESTRLPVTEIALSCGFQGGSYFTEVFHKTYGCSPKRFRAKEE